MFRQRKIFLKKYWNQEESWKITGLNSLVMTNLCHTQKPIQNLATSDLATSNIHVEQHKIWIIHYLQSEQQTDKYATEFTKELNTDCYIQKIPGPR